MAGHIILLNLVGGVALLLWGTHMVQSAILRAFGSGLRGTISRAAGSAMSPRVTKEPTSIAVAVALMLGADLGTTLAVQALSVNLGALMPLLLLAGVVLGRMAERPRAQQVGRMLVGYGLILLALGLIAAASAPMRSSEVTMLVLARLAHDPVLALIFGAIFTWVMHSSVAFVLFVISLTGAGLVGLPLALTLVLGANVGGGLVALGLTFDAAVPARRVIWGNLAFRAIGVVVAFLALGPLTAAVSRLGDDPGRLAAHFHTLFNLALALVFVPLSGRAATLLERLLPEPEPVRLDHLDPALLDRPALALNAATRAMLRLADKVELMLRETILTFDEADGRRIKEVAALENEVDDTQEEIKLYLAHLMQGELTPQESAQVLEAVLFTTNLEHIGDIIDKGLLRLAAKKQKQQLQFSADGWADIQAFHALIAEQMRRALAVFVSRDATVARDLVAQKDRLREEEMKATERHFRRLRDGLPETIETSALHLDVLRDLKRINAHLTTVAYPILENTGELRGSRLRAPHPAPEPRKGGKSQAARASSAG